eukprot:15355605-Ditylum_brightwellii.AAC.2
MDQIQIVYTVKLVGPPEHYLGNNFKKDSKGQWNMGCKKYITGAIHRVQNLFGVLSKHDTPMVPGNHSEMDDSPTLSDIDHQKYQICVGMLNWIVILGLIYIAYSISSLVHFVACPCQGHKDRALYVFGYLKKNPNQRIRIDLHDPIVVKNGTEGLLDTDLSSKLRDQYPDACESIDERVPETLFDKLVITVYVDSDHAHDKLTQCSITGLIIFVGRIPVMFLSKHQGTVETFTYGAEFMAMKTAVEEVIALRYMC